MTRPDSCNEMDLSGVSLTPAVSWKAIGAVVVLLITLGGVVWAIAEQINAKADAAAVQQKADRAEVLGVEQRLRAVEQAQAGVSARLDAMNEKLDDVLEAVRRRARGK